jgi:hypothetical protein
MEHFELVEKYRGMSELLELNFQYVNLTADARAFLQAAVLENFNLAVDCCVEKSRDLATQYRNRATSGALEHRNKTKSRGGVTTLFPEPWQCFTRVPPEDSGIGMHLSSRNSSARNTTDSGFFPEPTRLPTHPSTPQNGNSHSRRSEAIVHSDYLPPAASWERSHGPPMQFTGSYHHGAQSAGLLSYGDGMMAQTASFTLGGQVPLGACLEPDQTAVYGEQTPMDTPGTDMDPSEDNQNGPPRIAFSGGFDTTSISEQLEHSQVGNMI